jgi:hypothetical protein
MPVPAAPTGKMSCAIVVTQGDVIFAAEALQIKFSTHNGPYMTGGHSGANALRKDSLEICIRPENGWFSSKIRKIALEADRRRRTER